MDPKVIAHAAEIAITEPEKSTQPNIGSEQYLTDLGEAYDEQNPQQKGTAVPAVCVGESETLNELVKRAQSSLVKLWNEKSRSLIYKTNKETKHESVAVPATTVVRTARVPKTPQPGSEQKWKRVALHIVSHWKDRLETER